jgi:SARP family transcriptional regulator, regulator of embCAB operon
MISYRLLGRLEVTGEESDCTPTAPRVLNTLALLLVRANHVVPAETIVQELWGDDPPRSAATTVQTYIYQLRCWMEHGGTGHGDALVTRAPGYVFQVDRDRIDLSAFERLVDEGQELLRRDEPGPAADRLRAALALWGGAPLANVRLGPVLSGYAVALDELHNRALHLRIEADVRLGRQRELIGELRALVTAQPYDEWYHSLLVFSLASAGRRRDAIEAYLQARRLLADELGLTPSAELSQAYEAVLHGERTWTAFPLAS